MMKKRTRLLSTALAMLMLVPTAGAALTTGLTAGAAAVLPGAAVEADPGAPYWAQAGAVTLGIYSSSAMEEDAAEDAYAIAELGWADNSEVSEYEVSITATTPDGLTGALVDNAHVVSSSNTDAPSTFPRWSNNIDGSRHSVTFGIPLLPDTAEQSIKNGLLNGLKGGEQITATIKGVVSVNGESFTSPAINPITFTYDKNNNKKYPEGFDPTYPETTRPATLMCEVVSLPYEDGALQTGEGLVRFSWDYNPAVTMAEVTATVTTSSGQTAYLMKDNTYCQYGEGVPEQVAWTVGLGRNTALLPVPTLGDDQEQIIEDGYVNGVKDGDVVGVSLFGVAEINGFYFESYDSETVEYPVAATSVGQFFDQEPELQKTEDTQVTVTSMEQGTFTTEFGEKVTGKVATLKVKFKRSKGTKKYFAAPMTYSKNGELMKMATGCFPGVTATLTSVFWDFGNGPSFSGPNGESILQDKDYITMDVLVAQNTTSQESWGLYNPGENIIIGTESLNNTGMKSSGLTLVEIPFDESSVGKTFPIPEEPLENTSTVSAEEIVLGESVEVNCSAVGGRGDKTFAVSYQRPAGNWITAQSYDANAKVVIKPAGSGTYTVRVKAKDEKGEIVKKDMKVNVLPALKNTSAVASEEIVLGETIDVNCSATGGKGDKTYAVYYQNPAGKWSMKQDYSTKTSVSIKPSKTGNYTIRVKARDARGKVVKKDMAVNVLPALKNTSSLAAEEIVLGQKIGVNCSATGGKGAIEYSVWYQNPAGKWSMKQDYSDNAVVEIKPAKSGKYTIRVKGRDARGKVVKKDMAVNVLPALKNTSTLSASEIALGKTVTVNCSATGGMGDREHEVWYQSPSNGKWYKSQAYSINPTVSIKPKNRGKYIVRVKVRDEIGTVSKKDLELNVK